MRRLALLVLVALAALAAVAPSAGASKARHGLYLEAHAGGFLIQVRSRLGSDRVRLLLDRHGEAAFYSVAAEVDGDSVRARFGRLGSIDLDFVPDRGEGSAGCGKGEEGWQRGTFEGELEFHGEHHYAHVDLRRVRGWMETRPRECGSEGGTARASAVASSLLRAGGAVAETGVVLEALTSQQLPLTYVYCTIQNGRDGIRSEFSAFRWEHRERMLIIRGAEVSGGEAAFDWDLGNGTAAIDPPAPFSGRAFYRREGDSDHGSWRGSLSVPILGAPRPLRLTGSAFTAHLGRNT